MAYQIFDNIGGKAGGIDPATGSAVYGAQNINETSSVQRLPLGSRVRGIDPTYGEAEFIYAKGAANTVAGSCVIIEGDWTTTLADAKKKGQVGVAMSANVANKFGWYAIYGVVPVAAGTVQAKAQAYLTATAGTLDDAVVAGDFLTGSQFQTADGTPAAGFAMIKLSYPAVTDADNA